LRLPLQPLRSVVLSIPAARSETPSATESVQFNPHLWPRRRRQPPKWRSHLAVQMDIRIDANHVGPRRLQSALSFPPIDLSRSDRTAKQSSGLTNGLFHLCRVTAGRTARCLF
jgi:hypothetical protein